MILKLKDKFFHLIYNCAIVCTSKAMLQFSFLVFLIFSINITCAQNLHNVQGIIVNSEGDHLSFVHVMNLTQKSVTVTNISGQFSIPVEYGDSLLFTCIGYQNVRKVYKEESAIYIQLEKRAYLLDAIEFSRIEFDFTIEDMASKDIPDNRIKIPGLPNAKVSSIPIPLRSNLFVSKPSVLQQIMSPFSTLAYYTNKTERSKRKVLANMKVDEKEMLYREIMTNSNLRTYFKELDSLELERFITYCNKNLNPSEYTKEYYLIEKVKSIYPEFLNSKAKDAE